MLELRRMKEVLPGIKMEFDKLQFKMMSRGIKFELSIEEYYLFWKKSEKWGLVGKKANQLCLTRKDTSLPYKKGNILITKNYKSLDYIPKLRQGNAKENKYFFTITPEGRFPSLREAGEVHCCTAMVILKKINDINNKGYKKEFIDGTYFKGQ